MIGYVFRRGEVNNKSIYHVSINGASKKMYSLFSDRLIGHLIDLLIDWPCLTFSDISQVIEFVCEMNHQFHLRGTHVSETDILRKGKRNFHKATPSMDLFVKPPLNWPIRRYFLPMLYVPVTGKRDCWSERDSMFAWCSIVVELKKKNMFHIPTFFQP